MQVRRAYRQLVARAHPDKGGSIEEFYAAQQAYATVMRVVSDGSRAR